MASNAVKIFSAKALVVDDSDTARQVVSRRLSALGVSVEQAADGAEALRALASESFDLVILDLQMPRLDGTTLLGCIRGYPKLRHLPVIVLTSSSDRAAAELALGAGATSFLTKPLNWSTFGPHVRSLIQLVRSSRVALENVGHALAMYEADGTVSVCNRQFRDLFSIPEDMAEWTHSDMISLLAVLSSLEPLAIRELLERRQQGGSADELIELKDGRFIEVSVQQIGNDGWVEVYRDVTRSRHKTERIQYLARHDGLTGLLNRHEFVAQVDAMLSSAPEGKIVSVVFIDLDEFKSVNDTLGHAIGDGLLTAAAERLRRSVRASDLVARLGGDEFAIAYLSDGDENGTKVLAGRLVEDLKAPYEIKGYSVAISASIGVRSTSANELNADQLLRDADLAMYRMKSEGRCGYRIFAAGMHEELQQRHMLERDLRLAIADGQLEMHYQPLVSAVDDRIIACEALARWKHPEKGYIPPLKFIPLAEENGLIHQIGRWALKTACLEATLWPSHIGVSVNVSARQFGAGTLSDDVQAALNESGLEPGRLQLEITESILMGDVEAAIESLRDLRSQGIKISMDDFGTGYSSLSYLVRFPFDKLKIDKSFVDNLDTRSEPQVIIRVIIELARTLGISTTAEGVETLQQKMALRNIGCEEMQGYFFSRPLPAGQIRALVAADRQCVAAA